jgi:hypothetical protein
MIELLFDPVHPNAPSFVSLIFFIGGWGIMLGGFALFDCVTREFRADVAKHPQGWFRINGQSVTPATFENFLILAARIGRTTALCGAILILVAISVTIWRA